MPRTIIIEPTKIYPVMVRHYELLLWCLKARSRNELRPNLMFMNVTDGICQCTDGYRIHLYQQDADVRGDYYVPDGLWEVKAATKKNIVLVEVKDMPFPDVWKVFADRPENGIPMLCCVDSKDCTGWDIFIRHLYRNQEKLFSMKYLEDSFMQDELISFEQHGRDEMLVFGNEDRIAAIMPATN